MGGEHEGHFAAIKLDGHRAMDVDSALPLSSFGQNLSRRAPTVKVERIGEEIVNSISIHRIQDEEAHLDDIVAVLTNNDRTVRIFSLPSGLETKVKDLPFAINHATISPDGTLLVAVGDYNQAYFYKREIIDQPPQIPKPHNRLTSASVDWKKLCTVSLHASSPDATLGYFTTAWSPSGSLVAVGSEGGYITIMDREVLEDEDLDDENRDEAIAAVIPGSRADHPSPHPGAIRSMMFSPEPWDMLAWAEDQGRVCIGDLRTGLKSRQIISLEPKDEGLERYELERLDEEEQYQEPEPRHLEDLEAEMLQRFRSTPDNPSAVNFATEYIEARRRQREHRQRLHTMQGSSRQSHASQTMEDDPGGLTESEQQILETLRTSRQREEARSGGQIPRSVNYTSSDMFPGRSSSNTPSGNSTTRPVSDILNSVQDSFPELSRTHAASPQPAPSMSHTPPNEDSATTLQGLQDAMWVSAARMNSIRSRLADSSSRLPRRRQSVVLSPPASTSDTPSWRRDAAARVTAAPEETMAGLAGRAAAAEAEGNDENPWRTISDQLTSTARGPLFESAARAQAASPLSPELEPASPQRERDAERAEAYNEEAAHRAYDTQRRMAASAARTRERWRNSRLVGGPGATSTATADPRSANERVGGITLAEARRMASFPDGYEALLRRTQMRGISGRELGVRTAGLAWSPDGRTLWAACESGIFEIGVRVKGRMFLPSIEPR